MKVRKLKNGVGNMDKPRSLYRCMNKRNTFNNLDGSTTLHSAAFLQKFHMEAHQNSAQKIATMI